MRKQDVHIINSEITGLILACNRNNKMKIISISILTDDEDEYFVEDEHMVKLLEENLHKKIKAQGEIFIDGSGRKTININKFDLLAA